MSLSKYLLSAAIIFGAMPYPAMAQTAPILATVVATCGTPPSTYVAGTNRPATQGTDGNVCVNSTSTISGTVTANQGTPGSAGWPVIAFPSSASTGGIASVQSAAVETGHVIKGGAGNLYSFNVSADATLSAAAWAVLVFNSTTVPAAGAVTPVKCYLAPAGTTSVSGSFPMPAYFATGISMAVSVGQTCFTKTDSAHGFISANAQ